MKVDEYRFISWLVEEVPSAIVIRDLFRREREKTEGGEKDGYKNISAED